MHLSLLSQKNSFLIFNKLDPSDEENSLTRELMVTKYGSKEWNYRI